MVEQIYTHPDIFRIDVPLPQNPLRNLNSYVVRGKERFLVIDTGFNRPECREALFAGLKELNVDLARTDLFLTHLHSDHTGLTGDFVKGGSTVYMHRGDYQYFQLTAAGITWPYMENRFRQEGMPEENIELQRNNQARKFSPDPHFPAVLVDDGDVLHFADEDFTIINTPGHTKGLCCLYLPKEEIFFTSDHILFDISPNIQSWLHMPDALETYLHSLDKVRELPVKLALPGHRKGRTSIMERIDELKQHHHNRLAETLRAVENHPGATAYELAPHLTWSMRGKKWEDFPVTQKWFALAETIAHLEYLVHHAKVKRVECGQVAVYEDTGVR